MEENTVMNVEGTPVDDAKKDSKFKKIKEKVTNPEAWKKVGMTALKVGSYVATFAAGFVVRGAVDCPEDEELDWDPDACDLMGDEPIPSRTEAEV